jgi:hypothetical protein
MEIGGIGLSAESLNLKFLTVIIFEKRATPVQRSIK